MKQVVIIVKNERLLEDGIRMTTDSLENCNTIFASSIAEVLLNHDSYDLVVVFPWGDAQGLEDEIIQLGHKAKQIWVNTFGLLRNLGYVPKNIRIFKGQNAIKNMIVELREFAA